MSRLSWKSHDREENGFADLTETNGGRGSCVLSTTDATRDRARLGVLYSTCAKREQRQQFERYQSASLTVQ